ncbi:MAG: YbbR domain-containing protein [Rhodothermales bacterium]|jgi:YbbR domain-containing protein
MKLPPIIVDDWPRKLAAIFFAVILWMGVDGYISDERTYVNVPIKVEHNGDVVRLTESLPTGSVTIRGPRERIDEVTRENLTILLRVPPHIGAGRHSFRLGRRHVQTLRGTRAMSVTPAEITIQLDAVVRKAVPISTSHRDLFESMPDRFDISTLRMTPETVTVTGPGTFLEGIAKVMPARRIALGDNPPENLEIVLPLRPIPDASLSHDSVTVQLELYTRRETKRFENLPVMVLGELPEGLEMSFADPAEPILKEVVISGPSNVIGILSPKSLRTFIDVTDIKRPGQVSRPVNIYVQARNCEVERVEPSKMVLLLTRKSRFPPATPPPPQP